jgi:microcystin-dependent protein
MTQPYIGQITIFGFSFAPRNWAFCNGALLPIVQYQALFSIIGTTYGGDGRTTFALPNIQNNAVMNMGQGPGLPNYALGETSGVPTVTLSQQQMPSHTHTVSAMGGTAFTLEPEQNDWIGSREGGPAGDFLFSTAPGSGQTFASQVITFSGSSLAHENMQPFLGMNYCIAVYGIFPPHS